MNCKEAHFDYVDPANRDAQSRLEREYIKFLKQDGSFVDYFRAVPQPDGLDFPVEASVVIPVRNRARTIAQAVESALSQRAGFDFNVIVVDNASDDGTSQVLAGIAARDPRLVVIAEDGSHGIGGCWNRAVRSPLAGRYVVQLDSDDVYQAPDVLERVVAAFRAEHAAMVVGSYTLTDLEGNTLPPGLVDHREWQPGVGPNNLLRVNGVGAPRAFYTPVIRAVGFPDVSYGEDYAAALAVSGRWRVARIFDSLYLCRRWEGNTDHALSPEKKAANDRYKDSLRQAELERRRAMGWAPDEIRAEWDAMAGQPRDLGDKRQLSANLTLLHNPGRMASATARVDKASIAARPCFLCRSARPVAQPWIDLGEYELLANPMPIFPRHAVVCSRAHVPQLLEGRVADMLRLAVRLEAAWPGMVTYFNGAHAGASAPDHFHFQAAEFELPTFTAERGGHVALGRLGDVECLAVSGPDTASTCERLLRRGDQGRGHVNALAHGGVVYLVFRRRSRPECYPDPLVSPGAVEMAGQIVAPRRQDYDALTADQARGILREVNQTHEFYQELRDSEQG